MDRGKSLLVAAGFVVAAAVSAPVAHARPTCQSTGAATTVCSTNGSVAVKSRPVTTAPPANRPAIPWIGLPGV
ncbi:hypothetical protein [Mycobacterium sp. E802]|uniref:hypothetical protein n=1 Tax=Mycobacterium sp. E802 TaxID=1834152 RepID=UPI00096D61B5|nr:hypothetical protein [Mycobacterium sp. E802]